MIHVLIPINSRLPDKLFHKCLMSLSKAMTPDVMIHFSTPDYREVLDKQVEGLISRYCVDYSIKCPDRYAQLRSLFTNHKIQDDDLVGFIDADDEISPNFFEGMNRPCICNCKKWDIEKDEEMKRSYMDFEHFDLNSYLSNNLPHTPWGIFLQVKVMRRLLDYISGTSTLYGDEFPILHLMKYWVCLNREEVEYRPQSVYHWNCRPSSLSSSISYTDIYETMLAVYTSVKSLNSDWAGIIRDNVGRALLKNIAKNTRPEVFDVMVKYVFEEVPYTFGPQDEIDKRITEVILNGITGRSTAFPV